MEIDKKVPVTGEAVKKEAAPSVDNGAEKAASKAPATKDKKSKPAVPLAE